MPTTPKLPAAVQLALSAPVNKSVKNLLIDWAAYLIHRKSTAYQQVVHTLIHRPDPFREAWVRLGARIAAGDVTPEKRIENPAAMVKFALSSHASPAGVAAAAGYLAGMRLPAPPLPAGVNTPNPAKKHP